MTTLREYTHNTVPTQFVEADGIRFAYRRFGSPRSAPPLVLVQHFRGNLDNHDPAITDRLAQDREVILFDNTGVGQSTGRAPDTIEGMARDAAAFIDALGLDTIDIFGHSMGGHVTQQLLVDRPRADPPGRARRHRPPRRRGDGRVRRPRWPPCGPRTTTPRTSCGCGSCSTPRSPARRPGASGWSGSGPVAPTVTRRSPPRPRPRTGPPPGSGEHRPTAAMTTCGRSSSRSSSSTVSRDIIVPTVNSYILQQHLPDAQLILYPDSAHGAQFQWAELFGTHLTMFLDAASSRSLSSRASSTRELTSSLVKTWRRWLLTVWGETNRRAATSRLLNPWPTSCATVSSEAVSDAQPVGGRLAADQPAPDAVAAHPCPHPARVPARAGVGVQDQRAIECVDPCRLISAADPTRRQVLERRRGRQRPGPAGQQPAGALQLLGVVVQQPVRVVCDPGDDRDRRVCARRASAPPRPPPRPAADRRRRPRSARAGVHR